MKYSDRQRVQKIYDYAVRLQEYILENRMEKEVLLTQLPLQCYIIWVSIVIICPQSIKSNMVKFHGR